MVVFASWCAPCRAHLRAATRDTLLIGAFDSAERLGAVATSVAAADVPCLSGDALARALGVSTVPAERAVDGRPLVPERPPFAPSPRPLR